MLAASPSRVALWRSFFEDVTSDATLARSLRQEIELGQAVLDGLPDAVAAFGPAGDTLISNARYSQIWGEDPCNNLADTGFLHALSLWKKNDDDNDRSGTAKRTFAAQSRSWCSGARQRLPARRNHAWRPCPAAPPRLADAHLPPVKAGNGARLGRGPSSRTRAGGPGYFAKRRASVSDRPCRDRAGPDPQGALGSACWQPVAGLGVLCL